MTGPLVSVVIPTYNRAHLIREALDSVFFQTYGNYEVILVDDGSEDGTDKIISCEYAGRLNYISQENRGISGARNRGIEEAKGKYIAFLDSDDKWLPRKLELQAAYMEAHPETGLLATKLLRYGLDVEREREICPPSFPAGFQELLTGKNFVPTTTVMLRRDILEKSGVFDPALPVAEDWDLWLRIARIAPIAMLDEVLAEHRDHGHKTTTNLVKVYEGYWKFHTKMHGLYEKELPDPSAYLKRAVSFEYLLGTTLIKQGKFRAGVRRVASALLKNAAIGTYFSKNASAGSRFVSLIKPYGTLLAGILGSILPYGPFSRRKAA